MLPSCVLLQSPSKLVLSWCVIAVTVKAGAIMVCIAVTAKAGAIMVCIEVTAKAGAIVVCSAAVSEEHDE